jgi:hypothetical protein
MEHRVLENPSAFSHGTSESESDSSESESDNSFVDQVDEDQAGFSCCCSTPKQQQQQKKACGEL